MRSVLLVLILALAPAFAGARADEDSQDRALDAVRRGEILPLSVILDRLRETDAGQVLEVELENIAAQQKMIEVAQTASKYHFDETQLGRIKELVQGLSSRLKVEERVAQMAGETFEEEAGVLTESNDNVVDEVAAYFQSQDVGQVAADVK